MKIKQTIKTETEKEVELELPFYCSSGSGLHYYKIISETEAIEIVTGILGLSKGIKLTTSEMALHGGYTEITKEEFEEKLQEVGEVIKGILL